MKRLLINGLIFFSISFVLLWLLDGYYTRYYNTRLNVCQKPDWIFSHTNQSYDLAFMGNSRVYNMLDAPQLEKKLNKTVINIGITGSNLSEQFLVLDQFYKNGNKAAYLVLQLDMISFDYTKLPFKLHLPTYMNLFHDDQVQEVYKDNAPLHKFLIWKYIPFARYMEFSNRYVLYKTVKGGFECQQDQGYDSLRGGRYENMPYRDNNHTYRYWTVNSTDWKYFKKIVALAQANSTRLIFYSAPFYSATRRFQLNTKAIYERIQQQADSLKIPYITFDVPTYTMANDTLNFYDNNHFNEKGSRIFAADLADSLKKSIHE